MGLFNKNNAGAVKPPEVVFATARSNLLLVVGFTAINVILRLVSADMYFLFSAAIPLAFLDVAVLMESTEAMVIAGILAFLVTGLYLLCWGLSKKHRGWLVVALVMFALDTLLLFLLYEVSSVIFDVLMHVWVLYYLVTGTVALKKMKNQPEQPVESLAGELPAEPVEAYAPAVVGEAAVQPLPETPVAGPVLNGEPMQEE